MLPLDQVFLKVFQADELNATSPATDIGTLSRTNSDCDQEHSDAMEPQTINFPEAQVPAPQVIAFDQQARRTKTNPDGTPEADKEPAKFADDFCPSRRFRKLYILHREEQEKPTAPSLADEVIDEKIEPISRRNIQEQALRLLVEDETDEIQPDQEANTHSRLKTQQVDLQHVIPVDRTIRTCNTSDNVTPGTCITKAEENQAQDEHTPTSASGTEEKQKPVATIPWSDGTMPRICRQMLGRARVELGAIGDVLEKTMQAGHKIVGFKGTGRKCGASTLLLGAAAELALRGRNVLVVDGSFEHPSLVSSLELKSTIGWDDAVFRKAPLESTMVRIDVTPQGQSENTNDHRQSFCFLPLIPQTVSRAIVASCKKDWLNKILDLSDHFDLILIDTGSYDPDSIEEKVQEMLRFGVDGFFLVKDTRTRVNAFIPELVDQIRKVDLACLGIIENFT